MPAYAHSANGNGVRHDLVQHLRAVSVLAGRFAGSFGAQDLAAAAGICHDLGKFHPEFQNYLHYCEQHPGQRGPRVDHKAAGATFAKRLSPLLPLIIMAHHGGLRTPTDLQSWLLDARIAGRVDGALTLAAEALSVFSAAPRSIPLPSHISSQSDAEMFVRMVFSCLVDADFLDTEEHFDAIRSNRRAVSFDPNRLSQQLLAAQKRLTAGRSDALTSLRTTVADACEEAGTNSPGLYRMTVPTGGGKTLAGIAFALRHAREHHKSRVIVAVPYTSITQQTASVYRSIFGSDVVLEHHSAVVPAEQEDDEPTPGHSWQRLAAENWDAPVVVTTTVQLFESLLGNRVSTSRKLHNLAGSVLILDEVQMIPPKYVEPILDVLRSLSSHFGTTTLLSTATQPEYVHEAFRNLPEIAPDPPSLFRQLQRVLYEFVEDSWSWEDAAKALAAEPQAMMVVNTKRDARNALAALGDPRALHLSTLLCGAHRNDVLTEVKRRLASGEECKLVTTQVVEAGVDIDFPVVFRAMGPLDRIIQAAGRCNREWRLDRGRVVVFHPIDGSLPLGAYKTATQITEKLLRSGNLRLNDADAVAAYFADLYSTVDTDAERIQEIRERMDYPEVARKFRMIQDDTEDIVVPYGDDEARDAVASVLSQLRGKQGRARELLRRIQPYTVGIRQRQVKRAVGRGYLAPVIDGVWEWIGPQDLYDAALGLQIDGADEELLIG